MLSGTFIKNDQMPPPDALVDYGDGGVMCAMLHYAEPDTDFTGILRTWGFEYRVQWFECEDADDPLAKAHEAGEAICGRWRPQPPEGWQLGGVYDAEDGPVALFLRKKPDTDPRLEHRAEASS